MNTEVIKCTDTIQVREFISEFIGCEAIANSHYKSAVRYNTFNHSIFINLRNDEGKLIGSAHLYPIDEDALINLLKSGREEVNDVRIVNELVREDSKSLYLASLAVLPNYIEELENLQKEVDRFQMENEVRLYTYNTINQWKDYTSKNGFKIIVWKEDRDQLEVRTLTDTRRAYGKITL